jgi:hypothetical protein
MRFADAIDLYMRDMRLQARIKPPNASTATCSTSTATT